MGRRLLAVTLLLLASLGASPAYARVSLTGGDGWVRIDARPPAHVILNVEREGVKLRGRPFGAVVERLGRRTPFGSPRVLGVVATRGGRWFGVSDASLANGRLGWIDARSGGVTYSRTRLEIVVDLSSRLLILQRDGVALRRAIVGVGRPGSPTPTGRFAVTDKLNGPAYGVYYGCCILALSATQPHLPLGWTGGNRIAIHGTTSASDFGHALSAGCVHASETDLHYLMRYVPLGTPVFIHA